MCIRWFFGITHAKLIALLRHPLHSLLQHYLSALASKPTQFRSAVTTIGQDHELRAQTMDQKANNISFFIAMDLLSTCAKDSFFVHFLLYVINFWSQAVQKAREAWHTYVNKFPWYIFQAITVLYKTVEV